MRDFVKFLTKLFSIALIIVGALFLLFFVDSFYIFTATGVFLVCFMARLVAVFIQEKARNDELRRIEQESARVKYVIIK